MKARIRRYSRDLRPEINIRILPHRQIIEKRNQVLCFMHFRNLLNNFHKNKHYKVDVVMITTWVDFPLAQISLRSILLNIANLDQILLSVPTGGKAYFKCLDSRIKLRERELFEKESDLVVSRKEKLILCAESDADVVFLVDSDFLVTKNYDISRVNKPPWWFVDWDQVTQEYWKLGTEACLDEEIEYNFMAAAPVIIFPSIVREMMAKNLIQNIGTSTSELILYGAYAHRYHHEKYDWRRFEIQTSMPTNEIVDSWLLLNQGPPTHLSLPNSLDLDLIDKYSGVVFWSHWDMSQRYMRDLLFKQAEHDHIEVIAYLPLDKSERNCFLIQDFVHPDQWIKKPISFFIEYSRDSVTRIVITNLCTTFRILIAGAEEIFEEKSDAQRILYLVPKRMQKLLIYFEWIEDEIRDSIGRTMGGQVSTIENLNRKWFDDQIVDNQGIEPIIMPKGQKVIILDMSTRG